MGMARITPNAGRPRSIDPAGETLADTRLVALFTAAQAAEVRAEAKAQGIGVSELIRRAVLDVLDAKASGHGI